METNWAAEHLQTIRTLMERSAVYRRALAPVMALDGLLGMAAAVGGVLARVRTPATFVAYWMLFALAAVAGSFLLVRRQALKDSEPFWSPPTRRMALALCPALCFGCALGLAFVVPGAPGRMLAASVPTLPLLWLPLLWTGIYGCGLHAAGFFMPRGVKWFGAALVIGSAALLLIGPPPLASASTLGHALMGLFFGAGHLAYGIYLYFTERRGTRL